MPVRRAHRNHARGDAGGGACRRGAGLMAELDTPDHRELLPGTLSVVRPAGSGTEAAFETFVKITADGSVTAFNGHVDLGTDLPAKATGELVYVHDVRVPGMLHGRVVRPPYAGVDAGDFVGTSLIAVDEASVADIPGLVAVVRIGDFVGVVAEREENAVKAASQLQLSWKPTPTLPDLKDIEIALRAHPSTPRKLLDKGDVDAAIAAAAKPMPRTYVWPYQMHGSIGP